jgi:Oxidoreductase-like protein, N-terminal
VSRADDANDLRPVPPCEPTPEECCQRGCEPCIFDRYYEALERHQQALDTWLKRHPEAG